MRISPGSECKVELCIYGTICMCDEILNGESGMLASTKYCIIIKMEIFSKHIIFKYDTNIQLGTVCR